MWKFDIKLSSLMKAKVRKKVRFIWDFQLKRFPRVNYKVIKDLPDILRMWSHVSTFSTCKSRNWAAWKCLKTLPTSKMRGWWWSFSTRTNRFIHITIHLLIHCSIANFSLRNRCFNFVLKYIWDIPRQISNRQRVTIIDRSQISHKCCGYENVKILRISTF